MIFELFNKYIDFEKKVRLAIHKNGTEVAYFLFDGKESNKTDWFLKERLQNSSYTDLQNSTSNIPTNVFSIYGYVHFIKYKDHVFLLQCNLSRVSISRLTTEQN